MTEQKLTYITETEIRCARCNCLIGHRNGDKIEIGNVIANAVFGHCVCGEVIKFSRPNVKKTMHREKVIAT